MTTQEAGEDLMMAMELEMEARHPSSAAFRQQPQSAIGRHLAWVLSFAVPGLGMFTEGDVPAHGSVSQESAVHEQILLALCCRKVQHLRH